MRGKFLGAFRFVLAENAVPTTGMALANCAPAWASGWDGHVFRRNLTALYWPARNGLSAFQDGVDHWPVEQDEALLHAALLAGSVIWLAVNTCMPSSLATWYSRRAPLDLSQPGR
ncbi:hypothetical protein A6723_010860 [Pseudomonas sp. AU11447]|nr:hypothetical protein A6723_010860 [Pseudomonas sp. AU11447]